MKILVTGGAGYIIPAVIGPRRPGDLGWEPKYPDLRTIVERAWQWRRTHPNGYRS